MLHTILTYANVVAQNIPWSAAVYGPVISPVLLVIKKVGKIHNGEVMVWLLLLTSGIAGFVSYLLATNPSDPRVIAFNAVVAGVASQPVYKLLLKPAIAFFQAQVEKAAQFNADVKSAAIPASGLVATGAAPTQLEVKDFSQV